MPRLRPTRVRRVQGRGVRVFERSGGGSAACGGKRRVCSTSGADLGLRGAPGGSDKRVELFSGVLEVEYAAAWLGARVEVWREADSGRSFRTVEGVVWYDAQQDCCSQQLPRLSIAGPIELAATEVDSVLEQTVRELIESFRAANVKVLSQLKDSRARFEYELLQHYPELDVAVLASQVRFVLPLLADDDKTASVRGEGDTVGGSFLLRGFERPVIEYSTEKTIISLELVDRSLEIIRGDTVSDGNPAPQWRVVLSWAPELMLSNLVTQTACSPSASMSSVDIIASYKQAFVRQWTKRRDFIGALRDRVLVLEYDAIDFSRAFFMFQEQLDATAPLRIVVLTLEFPPEFFLTRCLADLQVRLLDGRSNHPGDGGSGSIGIVLASTGNESIDTWENDPSRLVDAFLGALKAALTRHFYE